MRLNDRAAELANEVLNIVYAIIANVVHFNTEKNHHNPRVSLHLN